MPVKSKAKKPAKKAALNKGDKKNAPSNNKLGDHKLLKKAAKSQLAEKPVKKVAREKLVVQKPEKAEGRRPSAKGRDGDHQYGSGYHRNNARIALKDKGVIAEPFVDERDAASSLADAESVNSPNLPYNSSHEAGMEDTAMPSGLYRSGAIQNPWYRDPAPTHPGRK